MKEDHVWFYERHLMRCYEESSLKHSIVSPNENFSEQELENFNRDVVGEFSNKEPLGSDNNGEEEEQKTPSYEHFILSSFCLFVCFYLRSDGLSATH